MNENLDIFICAHKDFNNYITNKSYKIICDKGNLLNNYDIDIVYEDPPTKYSHLQKSLNEFTRMYWVYKNYNIKDYIGFCHYRRYFSFMNNTDEINKIFNDHYDLIVKCPYNYNTLLQYNISHNVSDYYLVRKIINILYPNITFDKIKQCEQSTIQFNMFIMTSQMFYKYIEFISSIIDNFIKIMNFNSYEDILNHVNNCKEFYLKTLNKNTSNIIYQSRVLGFLVERISNLFFKLNFDNIYFDKNEF